MESYLGKLKVNKLNQLSMKIQLSFDGLNPNSIIKIKWSLLHPRFEIPYQKRLTTKVLIPLTEREVHRKSLNSTVEV